MSVIRPDTDPLPEPHRRDRPLRWSTFDAGSAHERPGHVADLLTGSLDGSTIDGVFTADEIARVLDRIPPEGDLHTPLVFGSMLGMPISFIGPRSTERTAFFEDTVRARAAYADAFGFDPQQRVFDVIAPLCGDVVPSVVAEDGRSYNPGNLRFYQPGYGGLRAHAGNEFNALVGDGAMKYLKTVTRIHDHLSWFVVLQRPEIGGELMVYDLLYEDHPEHDALWEFGDRDDSFFDDYPGTAIDAAPGSMVLFGGGPRWHRINPVFGARPRVTYGGFAAPSLDGERLDFWC